MKSNIHPTYYPKAKITCVCGKVFELGSTVAEMRIELCSNCHPFYTGKQRLVDTAKRVDKFKKKVDQQKEISQVRKGKKAKKIKAKIKKESEAA